MTDPLAEIKMRHRAVPEPPYEIEDTVTREEFYMRWRLIHYGPPDEDGWRDWWVALPAARADHAEFIAHAPADIDALIGEVERLRGLLDRLEWSSDTAYGWACPWCGTLRGPQGHHLADCELAAAIRTGGDPPEGKWIPSTHMGLGHASEADDPPEGDRP